MHQRRSKKILTYLFLLILVASINNTNLNDLKFDNIKEINVVGLGKKNNSILLKKIKNLNLDNIFLLSKEDINNQINSNSLVEKYNIFKRYPHSIAVTVVKTKFLAKINYNGKIYLIGSNGKLTEYKFSNTKLPFIFGKPAIEEFLNFKKIVDQSKFSYDEIKNIYFFSSKRWDLELTNNIIIKLNRDNPKDSLKLAFEFLKNDNLSNIKIIDARIENQIILNG